MKKEKIIVSVSGGMVTSVLCSKKDFDVEIIDFDNASDHGDEEEMEKKYDEYNKDLYCVF